MQHKQKFFLVALLIFISATCSFGQTRMTMEQTINVSCSITHDTVLTPFRGDTLTGVAVSGNITFNSDTSLVRIIVNDTLTGHKLMVYESYPMIAGNRVVTFSNLSEESSYLTGYVPAELIVYVHDATVVLNGISYSKSSYNNMDALNYAIRHSFILSKLDIIQDYITDNDLLWTASETHFAAMPYEKKVRYFGEDYNLMGSEYYSGGIYSPFGPRSFQHIRNYGYVDNFDWRSRHGANDLHSPYYDGDTTGTGWLTPIKCQGMGCWYNNEYICNVDSIDCVEMGGVSREAATCWAFGPTAQVEALINLYYNDHIDADLSEQYIICKEGHLDAWVTNQSYLHFEGEGVPGEDCLPYSASLDYCNDTCSNPSERIWIDNHYIHWYNYTDSATQSLRADLMQYGPMAVSNNGHCSLLIGWGVVDETTPNHFVGFLPDSISPDWYGITYWIFKDSFGEDYGNNGYRYDFIFPNFFHGYRHITPHITSLTHTDSDVNCKDEDGDGYYFWGIGPKPSHCPSCSDMPDGDDSDASLGPLNEDGTCTIINTYNSDFEDGLDGWIQVNYDDQDWKRHSGTTPDEHTGPDSAQSGNYYVYTDVSCPGCFPDTYYILESPYIDLSDYCEAQIDFYYHQKIDYYGNISKNELFLQEGYKDNDGNITWNNADTLWKVVGNQGDQWHHATVKFPSNTAKLRFVVNIKDTSPYSNIALDNITIGPWVNDTVPLTVSADTTWTSDTIIRSNIIIAGGATLSINNCTIYMAEGTKITVEPNATLEVDSAIITSVCNTKLWEGIRVLGDNTQRQLPQYQGTVELLNNSVIENAKIGITNYNDDTNTPTGGIISAENTTFRNNLYAAQLRPYVYVVAPNSTILGNNSVFRKCCFTIDSLNSFASNNLSFISHVTVNGTKDIRFIGCSFNNQCTGIYNRGKGIFSQNAGFTVDEYCGSDNLTSDCKCPENRVKSSFNGFQYAIDAATNGNQYTVKIENADFENNMVAVKINGINNFYTDNLDINLDNDYYSNPVGLKTNSCTGYKIEENYIYSETGYNSTYLPVGITINNAGSNENIIYRNEFSKLQKGINVTGDAAGGIIGNERAYPGTGLQFQCNTFSDNNTDINVDLTGIVRSDWGNSGKGADNYFYQTDNCIINNGRAWTLNYFCSNSIDMTMLCPVTNNIHVSNAIANDCNSTLCVSQPVNSRGESTGNDMESYKKLDDEYSHLLEQFETYGYDTILQLHDLGIDIGEDMLDAALEYNSRLLNISSQMEYLSGNALRELKTSESTNLDEIRDWYLIIDNITAKYSLAETYYQMQKYDSANIVLFEIPYIYKLNEAESEEYLNYLSFFDFRNQVRLSGRDMSQLKESEIQQLESIAKVNGQMSSIMAQGILCFYYDNCIEFESEYEKPAEKSVTGDYLLKNHCQDINNQKKFISLYPNPGNKSVNVEIENNKGNITMMTIHGKIILDRSLSSGNNKISTESLADGIYIYRINDGNTTVTGKWIKKNTNE